METPRSSEFKPTRTAERAQDLVNRLERGLASPELGDLHGASWEAYRESAEQRFNRQHERPTQYLQTIGRILSINDYSENDDELFLELNRLDLRQSGRAFIDSAKVSYCLREDQLRETFNVGQRHPRYIAAARNVRSLNLKYAGELSKLGEGLRQLGQWHYQPGYWARPLAEHILPLADTSQIRRDEVNLGVGIGLMMAYEAYKPVILRHQRRENKRVTREIGDLEALFAFELSTDSNQNEPGNTGQEQS